MYFWNIDALKADLRAAPLPALEVLSYALATLALVAFAWLAPQPDGAVSPPPMKWFALVLFIVNAVGLWAAYRANGGTAGTDLAARILSLMWVIGLRLGAALFLAVTVIILAYIFFASQSPAVPEVTPGSLLGVVLTLGLLPQVLLYWRLAHHLSTLSEAPK